jgi:hypothetical protein
LSSDPCFRKIVPAFCMGLIPTPTFVMIAVVYGFTLNSSAMNFTTAVKGASSGTEILKGLNVLVNYVLNGNLGSEALVILKETFCWIFFWTG